MADRLREMYRVLRARHIATIQTIGYARTDLSVAGLGMAGHRADPFRRDNKARSSSWSLDRRSSCDMERTAIQAMLAGLI